MMDERFLWIVRYLDEEGREVPVRELAERMDVSAMMFLCCLSNGITWSTTLQSAVRQLQSRYLLSSEQP